MARQVFPLRIACILPTLYRAEVEGHGRYEWEVQDSDAFRTAILAQVAHMRDWWWEKTCGKVAVECDPPYVATAPILLLRLRPRMAKVRDAKKAHEISEPHPTSLIASGGLDQAALVMFWVLLPPAVKLIGAQKRSHLSPDRPWAWIPCAAERGASLAADRAGPRHEVKEWFRRALRTYGICLPCPDDKSLPDGAFLRDLNDALTPEIIDRLRSDY